MREFLPVAALSLCAAALGQSPLQSTFASDNGGSNGGAIFFDLTVHTELTLAAIDVNVLSGAGVATQADIYISPGSYLFQEQMPTFWGSASATGSFTTGAVDTPSFVPFDASITLAPGDYAVSVVAHNWAHAYTNGSGTAQPGSGSNQTFNNADLTLKAGSASNAPFTSTPFTPRIANIGLHYSLGNTGLAAIGESYGTGCYDDPTSFYQDFDGGMFDMAGVADTSVESLMMVPNGLGGYAISPGSGLWSDETGNIAIGAKPASTELTTGDDFITQVTLPANFGLTYPGSLTEAVDLFICSNGFISPQATTNVDFSPSGAELLTDAPRWSPCWKDLEPNAQGSLHFDIDPSGSACYVTYYDIPDWGLAGSSSNKFQIAFFAGGPVEFRYEQMDIGGISTVGFSSGNGAYDPGSMDLSFEMVRGFSTGRGAVAPILSATNRPVLGSSFELQTNNMPLTSIFGLNFLSFTQHAGLDMTSIGAPGCNQYAGADTAALILVNGGKASRLITLPIDLRFLGMEIFSQSGAVTPTANALGLVVTNGLRLRLGDL